jgi:hypothetical protein
MRELLPPLKKGPGDLVEKVYDEVIRKSGAKQELCSELQGQDTTRLVA